MATDLKRPDGLEVDQFDHDEAVHQIVIRDGELAGYQRMLPTTRGPLLTEVLTDLFEGTPPSGPDVYELTRYAVAPGFRDGRRGVSTVGTELIAGFVEWGLKRDVNQVIIEFEPMWVLRALQLHFLATPLGYQRTYGNQQMVPRCSPSIDSTPEVAALRAAITSLRFWPGDIPTGSD